MEEVAGVIVAFKRNMTEAESELISQAISMINGVAAVSPHAADFSHVMAKQTAKVELVDRINHAIQDY